MFVCTCSWGGLVQDVWTKPTLEEARLSLGLMCFSGKFCDFDPGEDDARVFEIGDDGVGVEVYSFDERDFVVPDKEDAEMKFIEHRYGIFDKHDHIHYNGIVYTDLDKAKERLAEAFSEGTKYALAVAEVDRDGDFVSFIEA